MPISSLGERLLVCRQALDWAGPEAAAPERVARATNLPVATLLHLEQTGEGTAAELAALLTFYVQQDVNMRWLLLPDNTDLPAHLLDDRWPWPDPSRAFRHVQELSRHVQQACLETLVDLTPTLPLDRYTPQELADYRRDLPPVRAAAAGWQSRVRTLRPVHYYATGESVPACGHVGEALLYDGPQPVRVAEQAKCAACLRRLASPGPTPGAAKPRKTGAGRG